MEIDQEEAEVVRKIFKTYPETSNDVKKVNAYLNERNILQLVNEIVLKDGGARIRGG